jgi:hypothetical protein
MTPLFSSIVEWSKLWEAAYVSAAFGIGVMLVGGVAVVASLRGQDLKKEQHAGGAIAFDAVTVACVVAILAAVVFGIHIMTQK